MVRGDFPIVIVGIGPREHRADVAIESFKTPARAAVGSVYNVEVVVTATGQGQKPVVIELLKDDQVIDSKQVEAGLFSQQGLKDKNEVTVEFSVGADNLGSHRLMARVRAVAQEVNPANNVRVAMVDVIEPEELKVLFYTQAANFNV